MYFGIVRVSCPVPKFTRAGLAPSVNSFAPEIGVDELRRQTVSTSLKNPRPCDETHPRYCPSMRHTLFRVSILVTGYCKLVRHLFLISLLIISFSTVHPSPLPGVQRDGNLPSHHLQKVVHALNPTYPKTHTEVISSLASADEWCSGYCLELGARVWEGHRVDGVLLD